MKTLLAKTEKKKIVIFKKEKTRCRRIVVFFFLQNLHGRFTAKQKN
jgi:hypothetical protein